METPIVNEEPVIEAPTVEEVVTEPAPEPQPGEKTESVKLLESLQKEREKRREIETELENLRKAQTPEVYSDEGKMLKSQIEKVEKELLESKKSQELSQLQAKYPALKDKGQEFAEYLEENPGMRLETAGKAFLAENDLLSSPTVRKGLERDTGGGRTPVKQGRTPEEISELRVNNFRQYSKELKAGTLEG